METVVEVILNYLFNPVLVGSIFFIVIVVGGIITGAWRDI